MKYGAFVKGEGQKIPHERSELRRFFARRVKRPLTNVEYGISFVSEKRENVLRLSQNAFYIFPYLPVIVHNVRAQDKPFRLFRYRLPIPAIHLLKMTMKNRRCALHRAPDELPYLQLHEYGRAVNVPFLYSFALSFGLEW